MKVWLGDVFVFGLVAFFVIYSPAWTNAFFQDDFWLLEFTHSGNVATLGSLFRPLAQDFHYRPLAFNGYYGLLQSLFGLNWQAFHLVNSVWLVVHSLLVGAVILQLTHKKNWSIWAAMVYLISPIHYYTQYWGATFNNTQGATFLFLSFYLYLRSTACPPAKGSHQESNSGFLKPRYLFLSLISFVVALLFNESTIILPGLVFIHQVVVSERSRIRLLRAFTGMTNIKKPAWLKMTASYVLVASLYLVLRKIFVGFPTDSDYSFQFGLVTLKTIVWYVYRAIGLPEGIDFVPHKEVILILVGLWGGVLLISFFRSLLSSRKRCKAAYYPESLRLLLFGSLWFLVSGALFFVLPGHLSAYYLEIGLVGVLLVWVVLLSGVSYKHAPLFLLVLWASVSFFSIRSMQATHWVSRRGETSEELIEQIGFQCSQVKDNILTIKIPEGQEDEVGIILSGDNAARVICNNSALKTRLETHPDIPELVL